MTTRIAKEVRFRKEEMSSADAPPSFSVEEQRSMWYTSVEYRFMRNRDSKLATKLSKKRTDDSMRANGLESPYARDIRKLRVRQAQLSVFLTQEEQWKQGVQDEEVVSRLYKEYSSESVRWAREIGDLCATKAKAYCLPKRERRRGMLMKTFSFSRSGAEESKESPESPRTSPRLVGLSSRKRTPNTTTSRSA